MRIWRLCRAPYAAEAFSGEGARRFGGRWNSLGVPMVYASTSLPEGEPARTLRPADLPSAWWADSVAAAIRDLGDAWISARSSLALLVPSVPIRAEWNVLVNPLHPRIAELQIDPPQPFVFDARMFR